MTISAASVERLAKALVHTWLKGKYRVDALLGYGGAACVFAATHRNGHRVAIKLLHPGVASDPDTRARFLREGYLANKVAHPGAVRVLDDDVLDDGSVFLVMELLVGKTIDDRAEEGGGKLPLKLVCRATFQLLDVLAAAHARGIVHRDIKPQNLFWTNEGVLKVLDFGLARLRHPGSQVLTQTGDVFGTPAFMAPEQAIGDMENVGAASDQWSAAATFFNLATGKFVHDARTPTEMMVLTATRPPRSIREVDPEIPVRIGNVIDRALRFRREERWPKVSDFQRALKLAFESELGGTLSMPTLAPTSASSFPGPATRRPATQGLVVAALTAAAVVAAGVVAVRALREPEPGSSMPPPALPVEEISASRSDAPPPRGPSVVVAPPSPSVAPSALPSAVGSSASTAGRARATSAPSGGRPSRDPGPARPAPSRPDPWSAQ